ncbi:hypothetical protein BDV24DRAFT_177138 [Aspergillus arachidicola]|uniref:Protein NO VEIN C-terminal domain-containing protein n=1 Tax=Aspergillus arachidicola TaxID=656916 RepID=A0A5N6XXZ1_9EURO|nr:hypothetical protein BDV24DRAFT_177138 [Aspergillus arachidicola]
MSGAERARRLINKIADDHGYLDETFLGTLSPEARRKVEVAMLKKDEMIGSSVITLSKNLYNSSARFVFELLQNADDNFYHRAKLRGSMPFVSFHVHPQRIVVDCNEDGFTHENLKAICSVGKSSKQGAQGYIGEKGIGFKSVFMVAWKVHIQSGDLSFSFKHRPGDSGMGMISPIWEESEQNLAPPLTRITLYLHDSRSDEGFSRQYETTLQQFRELPATFLLFMKNLRRIEVKIHSDSGKETSSTIYTREPGRGDRDITLRQQSFEGGTARETSQHYYIVTETAYYLPKSENRTYTQREISNNAYATSDVVVALPLSPDSTPIIEVQDVYAFFPIRKMGFYFLIQADFVTDASRQDIMRSSARNAALIPFIAEAFVQALSELSTTQNPSIRYKWMRFLPRIADMSQDRFWGKLADRIRFFLLEEEVLWTRTQSRTRLIPSMRRARARYLDRGGEYLLPDLQDEQYLASEYTAKDLDLLTDYGLSRMKISDFLVRLEQDLNQDPGSKLRTLDTSSDWHTRVADILVEACLKWSARIGRLKIIPLVGGSWTSLSVSNSDIYFSFVARYLIPLKGVRLVEPSAELNPRRKVLFRLLGVKEAKVADARRWVLNSLSKGITDLDTSREHLVFLYKTAHLSPEPDQYAYYKSSSVCDHRGQWRSIQASKFYFPSDDEHGAQQLLQPQSGYFGNGYILHPEYISKNTPETPEGDSRSWKEWLQQVLDIRDEIPLAVDGSLSIECVHVGKTQPAKFFGFLLRYWPTGGDKVLADQALVKELLKIHVPCEGGRKYPIGNTYIRAEHLEYAKRFLHDCEFFPWLDCSVVAENQTRLSDISIVTKALGFGYPKSDIEFMLVILRYIKEENPSSSPLQDVGRVIKLYNRLYTRCRESATPDITRQMIRDEANFNFRDTFDQHHLVYVPLPANRPQYTERWVAPESCRWESPECICDIPNTEFVASLFQDILDICNVGVRDVVDDLIPCSDIEMYDEDCDIYILYLSDLNVRPQSKKPNLIYHQNQDDSWGWYIPSQCLWSEVTSINGMVALNDEYEGLSELFVDVLGVRTLTLEMVIKKLVDQGSTSTSVEEVKETIWLLNNYLQRDEDVPDSQSIRDAKVFPVLDLNGQVELRSCDEAFSIADRNRLYDWFVGKADFLDFGVNDIHRLEPFLNWISTLSDGGHQSLVSKDRNIALRAYGLLRIAVHYHSPRILKGESAFYALLRKTKVCATDGISSELHLNQDGKDIIVEISKSELHLDETDAGLTIYVPRDETAQCLCFVDRIPKAFLEWIMTEPTTGICTPFPDKAVDAIEKMLQVPPSLIAATLDRTGIVSIETQELAEDEVDLTSPNDPASTTQIQIRQIPAPLDIEYRSILDNVVSAARRFIFPTRDSIDGSPLPEFQNLRVREQTDNTSHLRSLEKLERDKRIGAAGELFVSIDVEASGLRIQQNERLIHAQVFEVLSHLNPNLPGFSRENWQSTIRKYVRLHEDYTDLEPWGGRETADLVYTDSEGTLTSFLVAKDYLSSERWAGKRPRFYLEVKSTTSTCETPFYMSKYQYERMQTFSEDESESSDLDAIYIIFRVFNIGTDSVGMKVYVDPERMRRRRHLVFTAETWSIVPGSGEA